MPSKDRYQEAREANRPTRACIALSVNALTFGMFGNNERPGRNENPTLSLTNDAATEGSRQIGSAK